MNSREKGLINQGDITLQKWQATHRPTLREAILEFFEDLGLRFWEVQIDEFTAGA
jgi:hypothetical protein